MENFSTIIYSRFCFGGTIILAIIYKPTLIESLLGVKMYQMGRINSWLDPYSYSAGDGYHLTESLKAIGSGQLFGKDLIMVRFTFLKIIQILYSQ